MDKPIIKHFTDNDTYTFSVCYFYLVTFPRARGKYTFTDRNNTVYPPGFAEKVKEEVRAMEDLRLSCHEREYMREKCYYFPTWFYTFLDGYRFNAEELNIYQDDAGHLHVEIEGLLWKTVFWEVPILAIISELKHRLAGSFEKYNPEREIEKSYKKAERLLQNGIVFSEFGTRRRFSFDHQDKVMNSFVRAQETNKESLGRFAGTSNVYFAMKYKLTPIGTMSHQVISFCGAIFGYKEANFFAMNYWQEAFDSDLGIFLYDTYGWKAFEENFSKRHAKLFDGLRVDSGDELEAVDNILAKYEKLKINPLSKTLTFSNGLNLDKAIEIHEYCKGKIQDNYGIGTFFTCDIDDLEPMNIVIKLSSAKLTEKKDWQKTIKLSEEAGKYTGDPEELKLALEILKIH